MADNDTPVGLKNEVNFDADPNLHAIKGEMKKMQTMLNAIKADINDAVANHSGVLQSQITVADIDL